MDSVGLVLAALAAGLVLSGIRVANQYERAVVFRLGRYRTTRGPGLYWLIPLIEWQRKVDMRILTADVEEQETITKDNVPAQAAAPRDPRRATGCVVKPAHRATPHCR